MAATTRRNMWQTWSVARAHDGTVEQWLREYPDFTTDNELMNWPYFQYSLLKYKSGATVFSVSFIVCK